MPIVEAARETLGVIDLDPASCAAANARVGAAKYYDSGGLSKPWDGRVFCNPPGGRAPKNELTCSNSALWFHKLVSEMISGRCKEAVFVVFNLQALLSVQKVAPLAYFLFCVPHKRVSFVRGDGIVGNSPAHTSAIIYLGDDRGKFRRAFREIGSFYERVGQWRGYTLQGRCTRRRRPARCAMHCANLDMR